MSARFELAAPTRIVFGAGVVADVGTIARALGSRPLLVTGDSPDRAASLTDSLARQDMAPARFRVPGEPTVALARAGTELAREAGCDLVIGFGGGSALDAGKAIAALLGNAGDPLDFLEVIGRGQSLSRPGAPFIAIPTAAGTGSEVTKNAVLASPEHRVKVSLRSPLMLARAAIIDPDLLIGVPAQIVASSGLDALSQLIEPFLSPRCNPVTDALARDGIRRSARSLRPAYEQAQGPGANAGAREDLALASLMGGLCLANAGLGAVHGFAAPVGGMSPAPHGAACAALLPHTMRVNLRALRARHAGHPAIGRFREIAALLVDDPDASAEDGIAWMDRLCAALGVLGLGHYGVTAAQIPDLVQKAKVASSMRTNPVPLTDAELTEIASSAL